MVVTIIMAILFVLCFSYYISMISYAGIHTAFSLVWLGMAAVFFAVAIAAFIMYKKNIKLPSGLKIALMSMVAVFVLAVLVVEGLIMSKMNNKGEKNLDYVIVLGAKVRGTIITKTLNKRLETAYDYLINNENTVAILSGGQGDDEDISEAEAMYDYLVNRGIAKERLIKEDKSRNTSQNIKYSMDIIKEHSGDNEVKTGIITSNFHVFRTELVCKKMGYDLKGIAAKSDNKLIINYLFREFFAVVKYKISGNI